MRLPKLKRGVQMKRFRLLLKLILGYAIFLTVVPPYAYAYLDPGTGSYFLQLLIGGLLGALFSIKMFWKNIKNFLGNLFKTKRVNK